MDPLLPILTAHSPPWNEADSPRTHDLEHLRAKRVAYYESIGIIKGDASRNSSQPVWTASQDTRVNPSENQGFGLRGLQMSLGCLAIEKKPLLQEVSKVVPGEAEQDQDQRVQEGPRRERPPTELDLKLLADALVPETEKLRHVINWAQKLLPKPPKEDGLKGPTASLGFPRSNPYQSSEAPRNKKNAHLKSPDCPLLLRADQSSAQTNIQIFSLSPPNNWSEMDLSSEFLSSFLREDFPGSESCECQETTVRNEGDGRAAECPPNSLQWEDSAQQKYSRSGNSIHIPSEDEAFPERLGPQPPLSCTFEESKILEGTRQSSPRNSYFWTPLTDSSEEEHLDEAGESKRTPRKCVLGRNCRGFSGIALSPTSDSTLASRTMVLSGVPSPGEVPLQAEVRKECRGPEESHLRSPKDLTVKFKAGSSRGENSIQRLPGGPSISPSHSSNGRRKESDNVRFALGSLQTDIKHKNEWEHPIMERVEGTLTGRVPRGEPNRSMQSSTKSSLPMITRKQFDLTHPESYLDPQISSLSLNVSEGALDNAAFHGSLGANVFRGPAANAHGAHGSAWFDQLPSTKMDGGPVQAPQVVTRQASHEQMEKTLPSTHPISRDVSKTGLKGSFPFQDGGDTLSWSDEQPHKPEQGASVLETYFYYLHMLNKSKGLSSEKRNSSLLFWGPGMCRSESVVTSPEGKGRSKVASLDRKTKEWRDGGDSIAAMESERGTHPQGQGCAKQAAPEETSFWKPQGVYGRLCSVTPKMTSRMTSNGGYQKMPDAAGSSHKHGDVKPRSKSIWRPSSAGAEKGVSPRTDPSAYTVEPVEKLFCKNVLQDVETENEKPNFSRNWNHPWKGQFKAPFQHQWLRPHPVMWTDGVVDLLSIGEPQSHGQGSSLPDTGRFEDSSTPQTEVEDAELWLASANASKTMRGKQVQITDCHVLEDDWLVALAGHQPRSLSLHRCRHAGQAVTDQGLKRLFQHCGDVLQELNVTSCNGPGLTGDKVLLHAGALCTRLTAVDMSWSGATDVGVMALMQGASSLQELSINGCQITDKAIRALVKKHGNSLHKIEVFGCLALTAKSVGSLAVQCPHLRTLNIGRVPKVSEACLVRSLENLGEVTALNVAGLKMLRDRIVHCIVTRCPKLDSLVISSCSQVTDVSLVEISTYLRTLRYLDVSGCRQITNAGIHALARGCHQLKYLDLSSTGISKRGLVESLRMIPWHQHLLIMSKMHLICGQGCEPLFNEEFVHWLIIVTFSLECVKLSFCKNVTLDVVKKLCKNCRRLKILHLYGCAIASDLCKIKEAYKRVKVFHDTSALTC